MHLIEMSPRLREVQQATLAASGHAVHWHLPSRRHPAGPADLRRQRVLRRHARPPVPVRRTAAGRERVVGLDADDQLAFGLRPVGSRAAATVAAARRRHRRGLADRHRRVMTASPSASPRGRRRADRRLRQRQPRLRRHAAGRAPAQIREPASPRPARPTSPPMSISPRWPQRREAAGASTRPVMGQGEFLVRLGLVERAGVLGRGKDAKTRDAHRRRHRAARRPEGDGRAVQGAGGLRAGPEAAGIRPRSRTDAWESDGSSSHRTSPAGAARHRATASSPAQGGVSEGIYASLNCGIGSRDDARQRAGEPRPRRRRLGVAAASWRRPTRCTAPMPSSSTTAWPPGKGPKADAVVTNRPRHRDRRSAPPIAGRSCSPTPTARVIGAAHAGWRGALAGVAESAIAAMETLGARRERIVAVLGPSISQANYEVGPELVGALHRRRSRTMPAFSSRPNGRPRHVRPARPTPWRGCRRPASRPPSWACAPMPSRSASIPTAAPPIAASRTTAASFRQSCCRIGV